MGWGGIRGGLEGFRGYDRVALGLSGGKSGDERGYWRYCTIGVL